MFKNIENSIFVLPFLVNLVPLVVHIAFVFEESGLIA
jgi:hypothetical protein